MKIEKNKTEESELQHAVEVLVDALKKDADYRRSWSANIAVAFQDECYKHFKENLYTEYGDVQDEIHAISNQAAENFLNLLCR